MLDHKIVMNRLIIDYTKIRFYQVLILQCHALTSHEGGGTLGSSYWRKHCGLYSCSVKPADISCPITTIAAPSLSVRKIILSYGKYYKTHMPELLAKVMLVPLCNSICPNDDKCKAPEKPSGLCLFSLNRMLPLRTARPPTTLTIVQHHHQLFWY